VYVSSTGPVALKGGAAVLLGNAAVVYGADGTGRAFDNQISAIATVDLTPVNVVDEFYG
jgi:hypothetical protein